MEVRPVAYLAPGEQARAPLDRHTVACENVVLVVTGRSPS
jgi:hypothetical protein